jgi:hypothetical protein
LAIDISLSSCAGSGGERNSLGLILPCWRERSTDYNEYAGLSADEQNERCGLIVDGVRMPTGPRARI